MTDAGNQRISTAVKFAAVWIALMLLITLLAGRLDFAQGWIFGGLNLLIMAALLLFFPDMPTIMRERAKPGPQTKAWDRLFWAFFGPMNLAVFVVSVLDGGRFQWTSRLPLTLTAIGAVIYVLGSSLHFSAIKTNLFYSSTVSIHSQLGHKVIRDGPYRFVRHPGYSGILLMMSSTPIILGSLWGLIPGAVVGVLIIARTMLEDKSLIEELPGYKAYSQGVKSRIIPGIW